MIKLVGSYAEEDGFCHSTISKCCLGKRESHKGFKWKFKAEREGGE